MGNYKIYITAICAISLCFVSCNRNEDNISIDQELMKASATIDFTNELDFNAGIDVSNENSSYTNRISNETNNAASCATITVNNATPGVFSKVFFIDYGTGCTFNGVTRSGSMTVTISNYVMSNGSIMTIQRGDDYYINGRKIEGTIVYENTTTQVEIPQWTRTISNGKITNLSGEVFNHNGTRTVKQIAGVNTILFLDNIYEITSGTHTISKLGGSSLTTTVAAPLIKKYACNNISQGQLDLQGSFLDGILDYGDNTCDNLATYTHSNGVVYNIVLN